MKYMPVAIAAAVLFAFCGTACADRGAYSWTELIETSDFIVSARVTKIEYLGGNTFRTSLTVGEVFSGEPPEVVVVTWNDSVEDQVNSLDNIRGRYLLFAKKRGDTYSLFNERFMTWTADSYMSQSAFASVYRPSLPDSLAKLFTVEEVTRPSHTFKQYKIRWVDLSNWLRAHFAAKRRESQQSPGTYSSKVADGLTGNAQE